ncbi:hypothetical protein [Arthrobacter sp. TMS2-4]
MKREVVTVSYGGTGEVAPLPAAAAALPHLRDWLRASTPCVFVDLSAPWLVQTTWEWKPGEQPQPVRIDLRGRDGQPIPVAMFRKIPVGEVLEDSRERLVQMLESVAYFWESHGAVKQAARVRNVENSRSRRGRKPVLLTQYPQLLEDVAKYYQRERVKGTPKIIQAVQEDLRRDPTYTALIEDFGGTKDHRLRGWINRAKNIGLIPPAEGKQDG